MARRPQFRDEDLLQAARDVFLARGGRATTAEVAERAGVSEGTLFHHFKTKEALFLAAVKPSLVEPPEISGLAQRVGQGELGANLVAFATAFLESLRARVPLMMLAWANADAEGRRKLHCEVEPINARVTRILAGYVEGEIGAGRMRRVDAEIAARALLGAIFDYARSEVLDGGPRGLPLPAPMFVRGIVDMFLHGVASPARASSPRRRKRLHH